MNIQNYIETVSSKMSPQAAFDSMRDAQINAIADLLIEKGILTREEIDAKSDLRLEQMVQAINKLPVISPIQKIN